jgi:hypothetical protein
LGEVPAFANMRSNSVWTLFVTAMNRSD